MAEERNPPDASRWEVSADQPLVGIPLEKNGRPVVRYFADEDAADRAVASKRRRQGRDLAGAWPAIDPDWDWEQFADELERIRHASRPTTPIDLDRAE